MALLRVLCWALKCILRLRFPPASSIASIQVWDLFWGSCLGFTFGILVWDSGFGCRFGIQVWRSCFGFRFAIQASDSGFIFRFGIQVLDSG